MSWSFLKTYLAVIQGLILKCINGLKTIIGPEVFLVTIPCFPHFSIHFLMFHLLFPQFLWIFPMFPLIFPPVSGLTVFLTLFAMGGLYVRDRFFCLLWEYQWSWEDKIFREFLNSIKVFGLKKFCLFIRTFSQIDLPIGI